MPEHTLRTFAGKLARTLDTDTADAQRTLPLAAAAGIDLANLAADLEREGVQTFCDSYRKLDDCIETERSTRGH